MYAWQFAKALYMADLHEWTRFVSMQNHYNLIYREEEREMMKLCSAEGIGAIPWSPLARGKLTRPWAAEGTMRSDGPVQQGNVLEDGGGRQEGGRPAGRSGREARDSASDAGAGLGAEQAGDYVADRGRDETEPSYGCCGGVAGEAGC
jgi:aryl-alcohol dehydrogenase-like predicted oxidoreductase